MHLIITGRNRKRNIKFPQTPTASKGGCISIALDFFGDSIYYKRINQKGGESTTKRAGDIIGKTVYVIFLVFFLVLPCVSLVGMIYGHPRQSMQAKEAMSEYMEEASAGSYSISWPRPGINGLYSATIKVRDQGGTERFLLYYDPSTQAVSKDT